jgi:hypothetical protein
MANYNYGINCPSKKTAESLFKFLCNLDIYQDGLDISEDRVTLISKSSLKNELIKFSETISGEIIVEVWPQNMEYDDAEEAGKIEITELAGKKSKSTNPGTVNFIYRSYSGNQENISAFVAWLKSQNLANFSIIETWIPEVEYGSYGVEFSCAVAKFDKAIAKEWQKKGVVSEVKK